MSRRPPACYHVSCEPRDHVVGRGLLSTGGILLFNIQTKGEGIQDGVGRAGGI